MAKLQIEIFKDFFMAGLGLNILGIDFSENMIVLATNHAKELWN